jgi:heat-inducible transcriptional repressor
VDARGGVNAPTDGWSMSLTKRQNEILGLVTERYIRTGQPVSSKEVASGVSVRVSPSTVRNEFAVLEELGYLTHPHTSAGRLPTQHGYRLFVDDLMGALSGRDTGVAPIEPDELEKEVDVALRQTSEAMAEATNLLALVVAPRTSGATVRHIELLLLQPRLVMVVFIVSTGRVAKWVIDYEEPVDPGMLDWARTYLNESISDNIITERLVRRALDDPELKHKEGRFLRSLSPAFERLLDEQTGEGLYVGGAARLFSDRPGRDLDNLRGLLVLLEERYRLLRSLRSVLSAGRVVVRIGDEHPDEALRRFSMVAASYGLPQRSVGAVSLIGPVRMDYENAISTVRGTAQLLSEFLEGRYE